MKKSARRKKPSGLNILLLLLSFLAFSFILSKILIGVGDSLLTRDNIFLANISYSIGRAANPFDRRFDKRLLATHVIMSERREHSEETDEIAATPSENLSNVLGVGVTVPVLMYHYIRINPNPGDKVGYNLSVTPENFSAQVDYLLFHGYHAISLDELGAAMLSHNALPPKPIVITFDDGYVDSYFAAFPILKSHRFKATNFIITGLIGAPNYLTWSQIDEMKNSGVFTFGSHTVHHFALTYLSSDRVKQEVSDSKNTLESHLGYPINWFAYPYGNVNARVAQIVEQAGYVGAFGTNLGAYHSPNNMFTLFRLRVGGGMSIGSFAAKLPWQ